MAPKIKIIRKLGNTGMAAMATGAVLVTGVTAAGAMSANMSDSPTTTTTVAESTTTTEAPPATRKADLPGLGTVEFTNGPNPQVVLVTPLPGVTFGVGTTDGKASVTFFDANGVATVVTADFQDGKLVVSLEDHIALPTSPGTAPVVAPAPTPVAARTEPADEPATHEAPAPAPAPAPVQAAAVPDTTAAPDTTVAPPTAPREHHEDHEDHSDEGDD